MNIVILGVPTQAKSFLVISLARLLSEYKKVIVYADSRYAFDGDSGCYDFLKVEIRHEEDRSDNQEQDAIIIHDAIKAKTLDEAFEAFVVIEPERWLLEESVNQVREFINLYPSMSFRFVYLNLLEFCKVNVKFLDKLLESRLTADFDESRRHVFYCEETNVQVFQESQFEERFHLKHLSGSYKAQLLELVQKLTGQETKTLKEWLKKAERVK